MTDQKSLAASFRDAQARLVVQTADLPLGTLAQMVESGAIDLQPGFQRRERWSQERQSALIESFLLNVPVPPVYLAEEDDGTYTAIDGKQRLKAIADFISERLALKHLERLTSAENYRFRDLTPEISNAFRLRPYIRVVTLLKQTDPELKYEVFLRLNTGGEKLNAQEIRNVAYRGPLNTAIYKLAKDKFLWRQLKISNTNAGAYKTMADAEYVLRFLTLYGSWQKFGGSLVRAMNSFMAEYRNANTKIINDVEHAFTDTIERTGRIWGDDAFKRAEAHAWRDQFLAGMYDAQMLAVSELTPAEFAKAVARTDVKARTASLFGDPEFEKSVRAGTNTPARIRYRVEKVLDLLRS